MKNYIRLFILKLQLFVLFLAKKWNNFWDNSGDNMHQIGELIVTGEGEVQIELRRHPRSVKVFFNDAPIIIPCNPHHHDHIHWHVRNLHYPHKHDHRHDHCNHQDHYVLIITWRVHDVRLIEWSVHY